ncbi:ROK family transcriptional regulator [Streptomyces sp. Ru71]|uniref:ROK family protein n=1 Tax=Streptomyces sp. Ru71 TaxID=2080746 RepID=UPI000CDDA2A4|nr:ROK family protein [Streptomyces sp. Ru71]POX55128.1 ROK family transcriptional regulator [Streptomyces sp. Ru71]
MRAGNGDASRLRKLNAAIVLRVLRAAEVATLSELAQGAGVSRPTAEAIMEELLADGWAEEHAEEREHSGRQRGRPARRFRFRAAAAHVAGVGVGASHLRAVVTDLNGTTVAARTVPHHPGMPAEERLAAIAGVVSAVAEDAGQAVPGLTAVGVGTTGVVDGSGRVVKSVILPGWTGVRLQEELDRRLAPPVLVENDMRLAVLAERWRGAARGCDDVVYLFAGSRLGLGLLIGGRPYRGAHAASGEIGRQPHPHWQAFRHVTEYAMAMEPGELRNQAQAARFAIERARGGDEEAQRAVHAFARQLGEALATVVNPLDPEMVVIGGSLAQDADLLVGPIQECLDEVCVYAPRVTASSLGGECIALGAARLALDHAETLLFDNPAS